MNNEPNVNNIEPLIEVLPPALEDLPALSGLPRADVVEIVRRVAKKESGKRVRRTPVVVGPVAVEKPGRKQWSESEQQLLAFEYYFELGSDRRLEKVAEHFGLTPDQVNQWSHRLGWTNRVRTLENRDVGQIIEDTGLQVILNKFRAMFILDPVDLKTIIVDPRADVTEIKDLVAAFVRLDQNSRERKEEDPGEDGTGKNKSKSQFMVNVIIEK